MHPPYSPYTGSALAPVMYAVRRAADKQPANTPDDERESSAKLEI